MTIPRYLIPRHLYNTTITKIKEAIDHKFKRGICKEKQTKKNPELFKQYQSYYLHNAPKNLVGWLFADLLTDIAQFIDNISLQNVKNIYHPLNDSQIHDLSKKMVCTFYTYFCYSIGWIKLMRNHIHKHKVMKYRNNTQNIQINKIQQVFSKFNDWTFTNG